MPRYENNPDTKIYGRYQDEKKGVKDQKFALVKRLTSIKAKTKILKYRFTIFSILVLLVL